MDNFSSCGAEFCVRINSCTVFVVSSSDNEAIAGRRRGNTTSLSMSTTDAEEGGGIGIIFRKVPIYRHRVSNSNVTTKIILPAARTARVTQRGSICASATASWRAIDKRQAIYPASARTSEIAGALSSVRTYRQWA